MVEGGRLVTGRAGGWNEGRCMPIPELWILRSVLPVMANFTDLHSSECTLPEREFVSRHTWESSSAS